MTSGLSLTLPRARALHLAAQGLLAPPARPATREDVRRCIERMALLQIDTIHVVARSPYLVLFSRLGPYEPRWLDELLESAAVFECWAHEACFAPIEDYPLHRRSLETRNHWFVKRARLLARRKPKALAALLALVRRDGPVKASDFERPRRKTTGWWDWHEEKSQLEALLTLGKLMVARREGFQRVYDLAARVYPASESLPLPPAEAARRAFLEASVRALGVTRARWIHDYYRTRPRWKEADLGPLLQDGTLAQVEVRGWEGPGFVHRDHLALARRIASGALVPSHTALLSPFDPVVWDRERAREMFGFDYRLECYLPAPRRRHGYFALPILRRGELVGRLDAKAHRAEGLFEVRSLSLEPRVRVGTPLLRDLAGAIRACAAWHGTPEVRIRRTLPVAVRAALARML